MQILQKLRFWGLVYFWPFLFYLSRFVAIYLRIFGGFDFKDGGSLVLVNVDSLDRRPIYAKKKAVSDEG